MTVLVFGSIAYDDVETPSGARTRQLGGSASYFAVAASYFCEVAVVSVVGDDFDQSDLQLFEDHGIDTSGIEIADGKTFHWSGRYSDDLNTAHTLETDLNVLAGFEPSISDQHASPDLLFLANGDPGLQLMTLRSLDSRPRLVAGDTMNHWITDDRDRLVNTIENLDIAIINESEALMLTGELGIARAARAMLGMGIEYAVIKRGEYGVALFGKDLQFAVPAYPLIDVVDPTGAGDSFAGGFVGYLANVASHGHDELRNAVVAGSTIASLTVQDFGLANLAHLGADRIHDRYDQFAALTSYSDQSQGEGLALRTVDALNPGVAPTSRWGAFSAS